MLAKKGDENGQFIEKSLDFLRSHPVVYLVTLDRNDDDFRWDWCGDSVQRRLVYRFDRRRGKSAAIAAVTLLHGCRLRADCRGDRRGTVRKEPERR